MINIVGHAKMERNKEGINSYKSDEKNNDTSYIYAINQKYIYN